MGPTIVTTRLFCPLWAYPSFPRASLMDDPLWCKQYSYLLRQFLPNNTQNATFESKRARARLKLLWDHLSCLLIIIRTPQWYVKPCLQGFMLFRFILSPEIKPMKFKTILLLQLFEFWLGPCAQLLIQWMLTVAFKAIISCIINFALKGKIEWYSGKALSITFIPICVIFWFFDLWLTVSRNNPRVARFPKKALGSQYTVNVTGETLVPK